MSTHGGSGGDACTATASALARAIVDAVTNGDLDAAVAAVEALRAFVAACRGNSGGVSDRWVRTAYLVSVEPGRATNDHKAAA